MWRQCLIFSKHKEKQSTRGSGVWARMMRILQVIAHFSPGVWEQWRLIPLSLIWIWNEFPVGLRCLPGEVYVVIALRWKIIPWRDSLRCSSQGEQNDSIHRAFTVFFMLRYDSTPWRVVFGSVGQMQEGKICFVRDMACSLAFWQQMFWQSCSLVRFPVSWLFSFRVQDQTEYVFTECDSSDGRWRVAVAKKPDSCETSEAPVRQKQCCKYLMSLFLSVNSCQSVRQDDRPKRSNFERRRRRNIFHLLKIADEIMTEQLNSTQITPMKLFTVEDDR